MNKEQQRVLKFVIEAKITDLKESLVNLDRVAEQQKANCDWARYIVTAERKLREELHLQDLEFIYKKF